MRAPPMRIECHYCGKQYSLRDGSVWGIYAFVNPDAEVRRPGRAIALGAVFLSAGVKWVMGSSFSKD